MRSEPTTAKGIIACDRIASVVSAGKKNSVLAYPDLGVDLNLLIISLLGVEGVQADVVVNELGANLHNNQIAVNIRAILPNS